MVSIIRPHISNLQGLDWCGAGCYVGGYEHLSSILGECCNVLAWGPVTSNTDDRDSQVPSSLRSAKASSPTAGGAKGSKSSPAFL